MSGLKMSQLSCTVDSAVKTAKPKDDTATICIPCRSPRRAPGQAA
jgi:hypothetical protein